MKKVYLAGPITGLSWNASEDWRDDTIIKAKNVPALHSVEFFSPLRGKDYLRGETKIKASYAQHQLSTPRGIMNSDHHDVQTCDAIIMYLLGAQKVSIGTVMEAAWAYAYRKPLITIMEPSSSNIHEHAMLNEAIWYRAEDVEMSLRFLAYVLRP